MPIASMSPDEPPAQPVDARLEVHQLAAVRQDAELPDERHDLRDHRGDGRAADAPAEAVDEQRVERGVDEHRVDRGVHRLAGIARGAQHGVQPQIHVRHDIAREDHRHVFAGVADRGIARAEEVEYRVEERQREQAEDGSDNQIEHQHVAQHQAGRVVVALSQTHRHERRGAHAHERPEGRGEVHQRESQRQTRDGQRSHAVTDEDAVHHVVERRGGHGDHRRHGVLHEQLPDTLGPELHRRRFEFCCRHNSSFVFSLPRHGRSSQPNHSP